MNRRGSDVVQRRESAQGGLRSGSVDKRQVRHAMSFMRESSSSLAVNPTSAALGLSGGVTAAGLAVTHSPLFCFHSHRFGYCYYIEVSNFASFARSTFFLE